MPRVLAQDLKLSVLQSAMKGEITSYQKGDSNAFDAFNEIRIHKEALIKEKKIKKEKDIDFSLCDEINVPDHWVSTHLGQIITEFLVPQRDKPRVFNGDIPWCRIEDIEGEYLNGTKSGQYVSEETVKSMNLKINPPGTVICSCSASLGVQAITTVPCCTNQTFMGLVCPKEVNNRFLLKYLQSLGKDFFEKIGAGTTIKYISQDKMASIPFPLPPIEEQARIVARVDELMTKIDEYEKIEKELTELQKAFPGKMKDAILQAAIRGELSDRSKEDTPIQETYKQMSVNRKELFEKKTEKPVKPTNEVTDVDLFEIPEEWMWSPLGDIGTLTRGSGIKRNEVTETGRPCVRYGQLYTTYKTQFEKAVSHVPEAVFDKSVKANKTDIVMALTGENNYDIALAVAYLGDEEVAIGGDMTKWSNHFMNPLYLTTVMNSDYGISWKRRMAKGDMIVHISNDKLANIMIPLPPVEEQDRIVQKLNQLLPLCDQLQEVA